MIPIILKDDTVCLSGLSAQALLAMWTAAAYYEEAGVDRLLITSVNDGTHSRGSKHHRGDAFDSRTKPTLRGGIPGGRAARRRVAKQIRTALGQDYDVVLEGIGTVREHLHVEYDPKQR